MNEKIRIIDLFAGLGGIRLGFEQAAAQKGIEVEVVISSEIKPHAVKAYQENFKEDSYCDISKLDEYSIPDFDFLLAGFPCQPFSSAGRQLGFEDTRGTLFFDLARIIKAKMPQGFLLENVEGLLTHNNGQTLKVMLDVLYDLGYNVTYTVLDGSDFGLAQSRKRIYIIGSKNYCEVSFNDFVKRVSTLKDIIENNVPAVKTQFTQKLFKHFTLDQIIGKQIKDKRGGSNNIHSWDFALKGDVSKDQKLLLDILLKQRRNKKWAKIYGIDWMECH